MRLESVVVSCQHGAEKSLKKLDAEIREKVLRSALRLLPPDEDTKILINPSGEFVCGGFDAPPIKAKAVSGMCSIHSVIRNETIRPR